MLLSFWYTSTLCMSSLGTKQQWDTSHGWKSSKQSSKNNKFQGRKTSAPLYRETKILNLTNIITLNNCMLVFDHLNSSLPTIFYDFYKSFKEQQGEQGDMF